MGNEHSGHKYPSAEHERLARSQSPNTAWRAFGPFLSGRQWGTVREDYSADGDAWNYFPFDHAHLRAYRWGEDGIGGICDRHGFLNLAFAMWNGADDRLKERFFGLTNAQGNHGEDVKEYWWHEDATPTHSYERMLYRYPQRAFPYQDLIQTNANRSRDENEYELLDTGIFDEDRFFDVRVTHAKASPKDICLVAEVTNHGPDPAPLDLIPQYWFRNTSSWGAKHRPPSIAPEDSEGFVTLRANHPGLGTYRLYAEGAPKVLACENETNIEIFPGSEGGSPNPKNAIDQAVVHQDASLLTEDGSGTKVGLRYHWDAVAPGETVKIRLRLVEGRADDPFGDGFDQTVTIRQTEADEFYDAVLPEHASDEDKQIARRAFAGLLWGKQLYRYEVARWLAGDEGTPAPPQRKQRGARNTNWSHLYLADVISMPDEWEYPWFATWDLAFHCVTMAHIDPDFAKSQLILMCSEWAQHPNGQLPAYEWSFDDVNPPVHAWAAWQVFLIDGGNDFEFLTRIVTKLLVNFTWWVNVKDEDNENLFEGGFLGMDNIGVFDRSKQVPEGYRLEQSDATSWMASYCLMMLNLSLQLAQRDSAWDGVCTMFLERFVAISRAMSAFGSDRHDLWSEYDGFYFDMLVSDDNKSVQKVPVISLVGLLPLLAVGRIGAWVKTRLPTLSSRIGWLVSNQPEGAPKFVDLAYWGTNSVTISLVPFDRLARLMDRMLDRDEFLSDHGIRSLSASYRDGADIPLLGTQLHIEYNPAESRSAMFGGNSNWRGPVWFPMNVLLVDALETFARDAQQIQVEFPAKSGERATLAEVSRDLRERLIGLFRKGEDGKRPGAQRDHGAGPLWDDKFVFSEYFDGDTGRGLGASHQTGWTALVAHLIATAPK